MLMQTTERRGEEEKDRRIVASLEKIAEKNNYKPGQRATGCTKQEGLVSLKIARASSSGTVGAGGGEMGGDMERRSQEKGSG